MFLRRKRLGKHNNGQQSRNSESMRVSPRIEDNESALKVLVGDSDDIAVRDFTIHFSNNSDLKAKIFLIKGFSTESSIEWTMRSLQDADFDPGRQLTLQILNRIHLKKVDTEENITEAAAALLNGGMLFTISTMRRMFIGYSDSINLRSIEEPPSQTVVRGSREGFVESLDVNIFMLRRRIRSRSLRFSTFTVGELSNTRVAVGYMEGLTNNDIVDDISLRIKSIDVDELTGSGMLEQYLEDNPYSLFPTIGNTERSDDAASRLLGGQSILFVDGDPMALIAPYRFVEAFHSTEDYNSRPYYVTFVRLLRFLGFGISIWLPGIFIMATNFDKEMIPTALIASIAQAEERVPFPIPVEVLLMVVMFELVREAGIRMPRPIGQAVSIVGALILGQVSVQAGLVGAPAIIAVAIASIAGFLITPIADVAAVLRLVFVMATSVFGTYGFTTIFLAIVTHVVSLRSINTPYFAPFVPIYVHDWKDTFIRLPVQYYRRRLESIPNRRAERIKSLPIDRQDESHE